MLYETNEMKLIGFKYRVKDKNGWPGDSKLIYNSGKEFLLDRRYRVTCKRYFDLNRCHYCYDKLNSLADISFGDCYVKGKGDKKGSKKTRH